MMHIAYMFHSRLIAIPRLPSHGPCPKLLGCCGQISIMLMITTITVAVTGTLAIAMLRIRFTVVILLCIQEILQKEDDLQEIVQLVGKDSLSEDQKCTLEVPLRTPSSQHNIFPSQYIFSRG